MSATLALANTEDEMHPPRLQGGPFGHSDECWPHSKLLGRHDGERVERSCEQSRVHQHMPMADLQWLHRHKAEIRRAEGCGRPF